MHYKNHPTAGSLDTKKRENCDFNMISSRFFVKDFFLYLQATLALDSANLLLAILLN